MRRSLLAFLLGLSASAAVVAQTPQTAPAAANPTPPPAPARGPALEPALAAAQQAITTCLAKEQKIAVSVVDSAGVLKVLLASDGAHARGVASSTSKAVTALTFKAPTSQLGERAKSDKEFADKIAAGSANGANYNVRAGGILVKVGDEVIGAIGVGGARGSEIDEQCAVAGLAAVQARLK